MKHLVISLFLGLLFLNATLENRKPCSISIMASGEYEMGDDTTHFSFIHDFQWFGLEKDSTGIFHLQKATVCINVGYNECLMDTTTSINASSYLVLSGESLSARELPTHILPNDNFIIPIDTQYSFAFNNKQYKLRAEGTTIEGINDDGYAWDHIKDYKLYISNGIKEQLILTQESFHGTRLEILFVGDIDQDGLPDTIVSNPSDYEIYSTLLFLSSHASTDQLLEKASSAYYDFSC